MASIPPPKILLVEGATEKRLIPELMEHGGVEWELGQKKYAVDIRIAGGLVTSPDLIETHLKASGLRMFG